MTQEPIDQELDNDPQYRAAVIDLLAVLAVSELTAFERMAADADAEADVVENDQK